MLTKVCLLVAIAIAVASPGPAIAADAPQGPSCTDTANEKKLAGAARNSFMKKCETDATARCEAAAAQKKLAGAAKNSFTKKCVTDAVGS